MSCVPGLESTTGTTIYVSTDPLTSCDAADYAGIVWTKITGVVTFPEWGDEHADITEGLLSENRVYHTAGPADAGGGSISIQYRDDDTGADILYAENGANTDVHILKVYKSGTGEASTGRVMSAKQRAADQGAVRGTTVNMMFNNDAIRLDAAQVTTALGNVAP